MMVEFKKHSVHFLNWISSKHGKLKYRSIKGQGERKVTGSPTPYLPYLYIFIITAGTVYLTSNPATQTLFISTLAR